MAELSELNTAIKTLNDLWVACTDNEKAEEIAEKRDKLDSQANELADKIIRKGSPGLNEAVIKLNELRAAAIEAGEDITDDVERIKRISDVIDKAAIAINKVASLLTSL